MEPHLFRRGNGDPFTDWDSSSCVASMEPHLFRRGNRATRDLYKATGWELQWSHIFSDVETPLCRYGEQPRQHASMEPHLFRRGNAVGVLQESLAGARFNGATS